MKITKRSGPSSIEYRDYLFKELTPLKQTKGGILVYDKTSMPRNYLHESIRESPYRKPILVNVDFIVVREGEKKTILRGKKTVLTIHGMSSRNYWKSEKGQDVEEIINNIEEEGITIDSLFICNSGGYRLPKRNNTHRFTYPLDDSGGQFVYKQGIGFYGILISEKILFKGSRDKIVVEPGNSLQA